MLSRLYTQMRAARRPPLKRRPRPVPPVFLRGPRRGTGAFALDNPELRAGALDYRLFHGGLNGSDPNDWFLRSTFIVPPVPPSTQPISPLVQPSTQPIPPLALPNGLPPDPPPAVLPPAMWPISGPELATDGV